MLFVSGYFKNNTFVPEKDISIPDGTKAVVSVEDKALGTVIKAEQQLTVFKEFLAELDKDDEMLPPEFDEIIAQGIKFEEVNFS
jgi:hypothetical protein